MIKGLKRLDDTIIPPSGVGDNWHMTWAKNDYQYVGLCDGNGWQELEEHTGIDYNSRIYIISGVAPYHSFKYLKTYPLLDYSWGYEQDGQKLYSRYYGFGILAIDNYIYHFLSTPKYAFGAPGNGFTGVKLIYSDDLGKTWKNQDGSSPVVWEKWEKRSKDNMLFFNEQQNCFSLLSVLQMGKNYSYNKDGYIYIYSLNGNEIDNMNQLILARVKKEKILVRSEYEYFSSFKSKEYPIWSEKIEDRGVVYEFPIGWVNWRIGDKYGGHPYAWQPSIVYNAPLDIYMMASWGMGISPDGDWFGKPSYLGFWISRNPWGPWEQIHEENEWTPGGIKESRAYQPQISPKWISQDGLSFWLVWTDFRMTGSERPFYAFNCQKVLIVKK